MNNNANHAQKRKAEAAERGGNNSSSSNKRFDHGSVNGSSSAQSQYDSRIVRVSRTSGGKDRHSKVLTAKGLRDRRVRLSVSTAIQFYDLQDRLGYDQPSKALEWLIKAAADAIEQLPALHMPPHPHHHQYPPHLPPAPALALTVSQRQQQQATTPLPPSPDVCRKSLSEASSEESHESQKAAAATTQRGVEVEAHIAEQKHDQDHGSRGRRARAAANNNSEPLYAGLSLCRSESRVNARERAKERAINQDHHWDNEEEEKGGNDRKPKPTTAGFFTDLLQNVVSIDSQSRTSNQSLTQNKDTSQINYRDSPAAAAAAGVSPRNSAANATGSGLVLKSQLDNVIQISSIEFPVANMKNQNEHQQIPYHHHHSQQQQNNNKPGTGSLDLLHSQSYSFPGSVAVAGTIVSPMATAHRDDNNKPCGGGRACVPGLMPNPNAHPFFVNSGSATLMHGNCATALEGGEIQSKSQAQLFHPDQMLSFPSTVARGLVSSRETLQSNSYQSSSSNSNVMNYFMLTQQQHQQMMLHRLTQQQHLGQAYDVLRIMDKPQQQPLTHEFGLHESAGKSSSSPSISKLDTETHQARDKYGYN